MQGFRVLLTITASAVLFGATDQRPLTWKDADDWKTIQRPMLSRDGRWLAYGLFPQEGDGEFVIRDLRTGKERREPAGALPPPPEPSPDAEPDPPPAAPAIRILFTADSKYVAFSTFPTRAEAEAAKKTKKEAPRTGLAFLDLDGVRPVSRVPSIKNFQVPERGSATLAYLAEGEKDFGANLVLRDLASGKEQTFQDVFEYVFSRDGKLLVYATRSRENTSNGVFALSIGDGAVAALAKGPGKYAKLVWDLNQARLAFLHDAKLMLWSRGSSIPAEAVSLTGLPDGHGVSERAPITFSRDGQRLFFGVARSKSDSKPSTAGPVSAELWHYRDPFIQPMQRVRAAQERNRSFRAVYHLAGKRFVQLADESMTGLSPSDDGRYAIGLSDAPYRSMVDYDRLYNDAFLIETETGKRRKLFDKGDAAVSWSPDGERALFFRDQHWHVLEASSGKITNLTRDLKVQFFNEEEDRPMEPSSYGHAGWTRDSKHVLLLDRFDVWHVSADGSTARLLTDGVGRKQRTQFRPFRLPGDEEEDEPRGHDPSRPLYLRAENIDSRESGIWSERLDRDTLPQLLIGGARNYRVLARAQDADVVIMTASTFREYPDVLVTDTQFRRPRKVTDANPQVGRFKWGSAETIRYRSLDGVPLSGTLYKPDGFDPKRKYPLLVYIYEKLSQNIHVFYDPKPNTSPSIPIYVSNGYLVLTPDIVYTVGHPGQSALKSVLPAIDKAVELGGVDENAIGIAGHSWGGYQIAYMITQTKRFRAAEAGAPVGNMTSAYNGIRWGSGLPRQFQYERTQSRIGGSLWDQPLLFIENSPVFHIRNVETPVLMIHNDADDAVPWYQGIELYLSLRRNGKEAYLFNYNGEKHNLRHRHNQKDWSQRMQSYFDHHLKGAPKPAWMDKGIPYIERETGFSPSSDARQ